VLFGGYPEFSNNTCTISTSSTLTNGTIWPAVTNTTMCVSGWYQGYKQWCISHAVDCVQNITKDDFPPMLIQTREQYLAGAKAANGTGNLCPIGENAVFCTGWYSNNGDDYECGDAYDNYTGPFSSNLVGCPLDSINYTNMAKPQMLVGTWNYLNESTTTTMTISGKIVYSDYGNFILTVPSKTAFGDYILEGSWGSQRHNILTECYAVGACENSTLTTVTPNHIEFVDNHRNVIHLMQ
jgi:hypothetical protein